MATATSRKPTPAWPDRDGAPLRPRDVAHAGLHGILLPVLEWNAWVGLIVLIALWMALGSIAVYCAVILVAAGIWRAARISTGRDHLTGWRNATRAAAGAGLAALTVVVWAGHGGWWAKAATLLALAATEAVLWTPPSAAGADRWWSHTRLLNILIRAGVVPAPKDGERLPKLRYYGEVVHDDDGAVKVTVLLPESIPAEAAVKARRRIAAGIPGAVDKLVSVSHDDDDPATAVTIRVGVPASREPLLVEVCHPTVWRDPIVLPRSSSGRPVQFLTRGRHTLLVGSTGSGKTVLARWVALHALNDVTVQVAALIGKNDEDDWTAMQDLCQLGYVAGLSAVELAKVEPMLLALTRLNDSRDKAGRDVPDIVVIIEEWYAIQTRLAATDPAAAKRCAAMYGELLATMRSRNMEAITLSQRATETHIPTDQRGNMMQRLVGSVGDPAEARYALGYSPDLLPSREGQFLVSDRDKRGELVQVPWLTDDAWVRGCDHARRLRTAPAAAPVVTPEAVCLVKTPQAPTDPLELQVIVCLEDRPMKASELLEQIDPAVRPKDPQALGKALADYQRRGVVVAVRVGKDKGWALAQPSRSPRGALAEPSGSPRGALARRRPEPSRPAGHARPALDRALARSGGPTP